MAKSIEVDINVNNNIEGSISQLKQLKRELKNTAVGTEEFKKLYNQIDDLEDKIKSAKNVSSDWIDSLESAGGPLGMVGAALNKAKVATQSFGSALKATGIGLIVAAVGGLVAAFSESESAMKKLEPLFIGLEKILGGIMKVFEPLLDAFISLALTALPYIIKGVSGFYSGLFALFTLVKNVGMGAGKILKGIFTLDWDSISSGYEQLTGSWNEAVKDFQATNKRFTEGSNELTKTEKKNSEARVKVKKKEVKEKIKDDTDYLDRYSQALLDELFLYDAHLKKIADLNKDYTKEIQDLEADTEQKKLDLWYKRRAEEIEAITKDAGEKNDLYALLEMQRAIKQKEIDKKIKDEDDKTKNQKKIDDKKASDDQIKQTEIEYETKKQLQLRYVDTIGNIGKLLRQAAGDNKDLAIAGILLEQASAVASIAINTQKNAAKAGYLTPVGIAELAAGAIGITSAIISAKQGINAINATGISGGGSGGGAVSAPQAPSFNVVGVGGMNQVAQTLGGDKAPLKAYVVSQDVTTQQALDRNIIKTSSLG